MAYALQYGDECDEYSMYPQEWEQKIITNNSESSPTHQHPSHWTMDNEIRQPNNDFLLNYQDMDTAACEPQNQDAIRVDGASFNLSYDDLKDIMFDVLNSSDTPNSSNDSDGSSAYSAEGLQIHGRVQIPSQSVLGYQTHYQTHNQYACSPSINVLNEPLPVSSFDSSSYVIPKAPQRVDIFVPSSATANVRSSISDESSQGDGESYSDDGYSSDDAVQSSHSSSAAVSTDPRLTRQPSISTITKHQHTSFWQYNSQSKGPRGEKFDLNVTQEENDPHEPMQFKDPVFDETQQVHINHVGKARKGDGTDMTPRPKVLYEIGLELAALNERMAELSKSDETWARKEKNRLASKVCRLKKKANNEANKLKYAHLKREQAELNLVLSRVKKLMSSADHSASCSGLTGMVKSLVSKEYRTRAAGRTSQLVDEIIAKVRTSQ